MSNPTITTTPDKLQEAPNRHPVLPLWIGDFIAETAHLGAMKRGIYISLLCHAWQHNGTIPTDVTKLSLITGCERRFWWRHGVPVVEEFFCCVVDGSTRQHNRLLTELRRCAKISNKRKAAALQMHSTCSANALQMHEYSESESEPKEKKKEEYTIPPPAELSRYAFEHGVIKLTQKHLDAWIRAYPSVAVEGALYALEPWAAKQSNWFQAVAGALDKREREARVVHNQNEEDELWENRELNRYSWVGDDGKQYTQERGGDLYEYKGDKLTNLGKGHPQEWKWKKRGGNGSL